MVYHNWRLLTFYNTWTHGFRNPLTGCPVQFFTKIKILKFKMRKVTDILQSGWPLGGGGGVQLSALTVGECENFDPFLALKFDTHNIFYLIVRGLKNTFFMSLAPLLYRYSSIFWQRTSKQWGALIKGQIGQQDQTSFFLV